MESPVLANKSAHESLTNLRADISSVIEQSFGPVDDEISFLPQQHALQGKKIEGIKYTCRLISTCY